MLCIFAVLAAPMAVAESVEKEPISLNFHDAELSAVLAAIADFTGLDIIVSDAVRGRVTLRLDRVPWDQALELVLRSQGLSSQRQGNVIMVAPAMQTASQVVAPAIRMPVESTPSLVLEQLTLRYARAADMASLLRGEQGLGLLSEYGRVAVDERTNTLLVQDRQQRLASIRNMLQSLDIPAAQVQIEARIVVVRDSAAREIGIDWGLSSRRGLIAGSDGRTRLADRFSGRGGHGGLAVDLGDPVAPGGAFNVGYLASDVLLDLELRALESEGRSKTISEPRIITANQHPAVIKQGKEVPYQEETSSGATNTEFKEAVLALEVTPQITSDDAVVLDLRINNDTIADQSFAGAPAIDTNQIATRVRVANGATVVLGGILTHDQARNLHRIPWLGDLPLLGNLFRYTEEVRDRVELLVFITPRILDDGLAVADAGST
ncbi:hypothetical protein BJB45_01635 [Halomonas huangheensis]|uniref:Secretin/TonB short N-terminal domain-containing protein n=2 Tax=Halomonas huangheensis TaxID=1178482 RepID=W1N4K3_9GAMM|nr:pilus assembly protein PilQ [Halomonas huangheensis]ERL49850.1 hypothetical protein BJB45_01635 [Halomonas huangheensis]